MNRLILIMILLSPSLAAPAEPIYKSVDEQGKVTYSAEPSAEGVSVEQLKVAPPPSADEVQRAEEQTQKLKEQAAELEKERKAREAEQAAAAKADAAASGGHTVVVPVPGVVDDPTRIPLRPALPAGPARPVPTPLPARPPVRR